MVQETYDTTPPNHLVQLYDLDDEMLVRNVGAYLSEGLRHGDGVVIVAGPEHQRSFAAELESLGIDVQQALAGGLFVQLDARETLDRILVQGSPDRAHFESTIGPVVAQVRRTAPTGEVRAYGEMVGLLWLSGDVTAAIELEELWDGQLASGNVAGVFCGYPIDILGKEFQPALVEKVLCAHTTVVSSGSDRLGAAIDRAVKELAGPHAIASDARRSNLPKADATALWIRGNMPRQADEILNRARLYYKS